ncbi:site-specific integrase [Halanaeroarchaeum sp. HSR-CO]|uniref:tyrosine-type recombinase/integrase n=1 Tax=Halanaeroarchaeum sp. HSR-CO TaxID=2866382 RepID=UPI00217CF27A|nr:site-specific integrase [Halanaeroarchaeum sp. HSR-CO]
MSQHQTQFQDTLDSLDRRVEDGEIHPDDGDAIRELCAAYDAEDATESLPRDLYDDRKDGHKARGTLDAWAERLSVAAKDLHLTGDETDADTVNAWTTGRVKAKDGPGLSRVADIENALKKFYRYHADLGVDPADITVHERSKTTPWTEGDMLTPEERAALRTVVDHPRDAAILHLLLYAGMRNTALRTLRVKDVDLDAGVWSFNTDADGLKNIDRPGEPRPLSQAYRAVRDWLDFHPTGDPEDYLITAKPGASKMDPTTPVTKETIRYTMAQLKKKTAERVDVVTVSKPAHPHMMRHNFVNTCLKHPDITTADIKFWLGHAPASDVMEETYSHLTGDDHNAAAHNAFGVPGVRENGDEVDPWDTVCDDCLRVLSPGEDTCPECETARGATPWTDAVDVPGLTAEDLGRLEGLLDAFAPMLDDESGGGGLVGFRPDEDGNLVPTESAQYAEDSDGMASAEATPLTATEDVERVDEDGAED